MTNYRYPSPQEIHAIERAARRARAAALARVAKMAFAGVKSLFAGAQVGLKEPRHAA